MPHSTAPGKSQAAWTDPDTFALTLLALFIDHYGTEGLSWHPATMAMEIEDDFKVKLPQLNHDRLLVGVQLLTTDLFYKSLPDFINFCNVLSGDLFDPAQWDPADSLEVAWGVTEAMLINPPEEEEPFTDEIRSYIGHALDAEGIMNAPDILQLALRDATPDIQREFSDDPEMFSAIYQLEADKTADVNTALRRNLAALVQQLESLQLNSGSTKNVVKMLLQAGR